MPETPNPGLLAFRPRQVVLLANQNQNQNINITNKTTLNSEQKVLLLHSVARFLGRNGFSKSLKKFRSESHIQIDTLKDSLLDLEELYIKYIEMWDNAKTNFKGQNGHEKQVRTEEEKKLEPQPKEPGKYKDKKKKKNELISESESKPSTAEEKIADVSLEGENFTGSETHKKNTKDKEKKRSRRRMILLLIMLIPELLVLLQWILMTPQWKRQVPSQQLRRKRRMLRRKYMQIVLQGMIPKCLMWMLLRITKVLKGEKDWVLMKVI